MAGLFGKILSILSGAPEHSVSEGHESTGKYLAKADDPVDLLFVKKFTDGGGLFIYCGSPEEVLTNLSAAAKECGQSQFFVPETGLIPWFQEAGLTVIKDNPLEVSAMASSCHAAIAQTGGIMISDLQTAGLKFAQLPSIHIVFARVSQVVNSLSDGMAAINKSHREQRPRAIITLKGKLDESVMQAKVDPNKGRHLYLFLLEDHLFSEQA
ncbi:MAG: LUD domain-containing protein [Schleiferiaceae bacterium]|nr:LUD domain-containing protein [Schleiferiaceae bacterium]